MVMENFLIAIKSTVMKMVFDQLLLSNASCDLWVEIPLFFLDLTAPLLDLQGFNSDDPGPFL